MQAVDSTGLVVPAAGKTVAVVGLDDVVVIDTPDALLVTTRARAQQVKDVVAALKARAATTSPRRAYRSSRHRVGLGGSR